MTVDTKRSEVELVFELLDQSANLISKNIDVPYIEALVYTGENIFYQEVEIEGLEEKHVETLKKLYQETRVEEFKQESIRKGFQLAILKGLKDNVQPQHVMTPDAVALFMSYLVNKAIGNRENLKILDLGIGSGNLVSAILNNTDKINQSYGVEIDDILLNLAFVSMNLQKHAVELYKQDALSPLFIDPVDIIVCDLPVGYYPDDIQAKDFVLASKDGHSYAHHLYIEQSFKYVKDGGILFFLIPNHLFSQDAKDLHNFINENGYIHGLLQLPETMFKSKEHAKSIFFLQKKGGNATPSKQALLAELPSFKKADSLSKMVTEIDLWFKNSYQKNSN